MARKLTNIVKGAALKLDTTNTYAIEKQVALPVCYGSAEGAWNAVVAYNGTTSTYSGKIFDNVGWVRGTRQQDEEWGAYLWVLQNHIEFQASTSAWWSTTSGIPVAISNVMVGSLGDYQATSNVVDTGPVIPSNCPGANDNDSHIYQVDITNVYYTLIIPDIWIMPRDAFAPLGSTNPAQYTVTGTNIPQGVTWITIPDLSGSGGATIISNGAWQAVIMPGNIATNYIVRATSKDNTNFYDQVSLTVIKVDMKSVIFTSDHGVLTDYTNDFSGGGGTVFNPRGWTASGTNNPISQTKDTKLAANVTLCVQPSGIAYDLTGDGSLGYFTFHTNGLTSSGSDQTFSLSADANLPAQVDVLSQGINWSINVVGVSCVATSSGPHKVYVTWGMPTGTGPTLKRMDWTANLAKPSTNMDQIANAIGPDAVAGGRFGGNSIFGSPPTLTTAWQVMDGYNGDCGSLSTLMQYELDMLGATGSVVRFVYARHATWTGLSQPSPPYSSYSETNSAGSKLIMWFAGGSGAGGNVYEGCCEFLSKWWMGGNGFATNSAYDVLMYSTSPNTDGTNNSHQCWESNVTNAVAYPPGTP